MHKHEHGLFGGRVLRMLAGALLLALVAAFTLEFVYLNSSAFILYSFPLFLALGAFLGVYERHITAAAAAAIVFIAVAATFYTADSILLQFVWENLAIIGYYLLISAVVGIFISILAEANGWKARFSLTASRLSRMAHSRAAGYAAVVAAAALLAAPIWPSSMGVPISQYVNMTEYVQYYGNITSAASYTQITDPPPYNYTTALCANGTNGRADVHFQRIGGAAYAFLFDNKSAMQKAAQSAMSYPFHMQPGIYRQYASAYLYSKGTNASASIDVPDYGCAYMVLLFGNLSTVRVGYSISYYGLTGRYEQKMGPSPEAVLVVNGTSDIVGGISYISRRYLLATEPELNATAYSSSS